MQLANPASQDQDVLRTSAIPSILDGLWYNLRHADRDVDLFELFPIYLRQEEGLPEEAARADPGHGGLPLRHR